MAATQNNNEQNFRETGKFKPISDYSHPSTERQLKCTFNISSFHSVSLGAVINDQQHQQTQTKYWRFYFQDNQIVNDKNGLINTIQSCFQLLLRSDQLQQTLNGEIFINVNNILIERVRGYQREYHISYLDYNCIIVKTKKTKNIQGEVICFLDCYQVRIGRTQIQQNQFNEEIYLKINQQYRKFYLFSKASDIFLTHDSTKNGVTLQITEQNLQESFADIAKHLLIIKNLSPRIIAIKFMEQNCMKNTQSLQMVFTSREFYSAILLRINRIKYGKYKFEETQTKQWHSFDHKTQVDSKKGSNATPQKLKYSNSKPNLPTNTINKITTSKSTNLRQEQIEQQTKKGSKGNILNQPKNMKISQRVITNPKESNLVPSDLDYPVSVNDEKQKESGYFDQFQNLLYEEQGTDEKQLTLNDSFQEFQKKENSVKNQEIIKELNKRKEKQTEEKKQIDSLKDKIKELINQQKQWINKNFKLKVEIKKIKQTEIKTESNKEIDDIKSKIGQLKKYEKKLIQDLAQIRSKNNIQALIFGQAASPQSSQRNNNPQGRVLQSFASFPVDNSLMGPLTTSIRSNNSPSPVYKSNQPFPPPAVTRINPVTNNFNPQPMNSTNFKQNYQTNPPHLQNGQNRIIQQVHQPPGLSIYSSVPATQSFIQTNNANFNNMNPRIQNSSPNHVLINNNDYTGYPQQRPIGTGFTSGIYNASRVPMSPQADPKKMFPSYNVGNKM